MHGDGGEEGANERQLAALGGRQQRQQRRPHGIPALILPLIGRKHVDY